MSIGKTYIFLGILIHMSSEKISKIKDYWRTPRGSLDRLSYVSRYMSLRRFELFHRMFTIVGVRPHPGT
jgi:Transposase IS4